MRVKLRFALAFGASWACVASRAEAAPSARLVYIRDVGAEDCPDESALRAAVAARLGYDPFFPHASATLFAEIRRKGGTYVAHVKLVDEQNVVRGARDLSHAGPRCAELIDTMALSMSVAIDPKSLVGRKPSEDPPDASAETRTETESAPTSEIAPKAESQPQAEIAPPTPAPSPPRRATSEASRVDVVASLVGTGWIGAAPSPNVGGLVGVGLRTGRFDVALEGRVDAPAAKDVARGTVETSFLGGTLVPCVRFGVVAGCVLGTLGRLSAEGRGIAIPRTDAAVHAFVGSRWGAVVPLTERFELRVQADVLFGITPRTLQIDGQNAYVMPRVSAGLGLGVAVRIN